MSLLSCFEKLKGLRRRMYYLSKRIEFCKEQSLLIPGPIYGDDKVQSEPSGKAPFEKWVLKQLDFEMELEKLEKEYESLSVKTTELLEDTIKSEKTLLVLMYREILFLPYIEVAKKVNLSLSYVYKLHHEGMEEIKRAFLLYESS